MDSVEYADETLYTHFIMSNYTSYVQYLEHLVRELEDELDQAELKLKTSSELQD